MTYAVTVVPGDGIGPSVVEAARRVLAATGADIEWDEQRLGGPDDPLPDATLASIRRNGVALKGPVATGVKGGRSANVGLRRALGLNVQFRPSRTLPGIRRHADGDIDVVVVRETTEDLYRGIEVAAGSDEARELAAWLRERGLDDGLDDAGFSIKPATEAAVRRAFESTLDWMRTAGRERVTVLHKATVMRATDGIYLDVAEELEARYDDIGFARCQIDAACARLVESPQSFDVLFMPNMYGDLLSDLAAALCGGIGLAPGANHGDGVAVFEPVHGTAPTHVGRDDVNPLAMVRCGALLLAHLGENERARRVERAVEELLRAGEVVTYDVLGTSDGAATTTDVADELVRLVSR